MASDSTVLVNKKFTPPQEEIERVRDFVGEIIHIEDDEIDVKSVEKDIEKEHLNKILTALDAVRKKSSGLDAQGFLLNAQYNIISYLNYKKLKRKR
jgi:hypothetical protein